MHDADTERLRLPVLGAISPNEALRLGLDEVLAEAVKAVYERTVSGLRILGHAQAADDLDAEQALAVDRLVVQAPLSTSGDAVPTLRTPRRRGTPPGSEVLPPLDGEPATDTGPVDRKPTPPVVEKL